MSENLYRHDSPLRRRPHYHCIGSCPRRLVVASDDQPERLAVVRDLNSHKFRIEKKKFVELSGTLIAKVER